VKFGLTIPNLGEYADPALLADLAAEGEQAGWDGVFVWDHLVYRRDPVYAVTDPFVALAAMACATSRVWLGPLVTPLARRRPAVVARQMTSLQQLAGPRVLLGVGLGTPPDVEFEALGDDPDPRVRGERLDEALEIITALWSGQHVDLTGRHFVARDVTFRPAPTAPIPIWVAGRAPRPWRRAARYDGVFPLTEDSTASPELISEVVEVCRRAGAGEDRPFEVVAEGRSEGPHDVEQARAYEAAGATWYLEHISWKRATLEDCRARIGQAPPR